MLATSSNQGWMLRRFEEWILQTIEGGSQGRKKVLVNSLARRSVKKLSRLYLLMYLYELVLLLLLLLLVVVVLLLVVLAAFLLGWDGTELPKSHGPSPTSFQTCDYSHIIVTKKSMYNNLWIWIFGGVT
jgi:hypothetical protein